jgi:putative tryptophan/tyrosine transport system substrate-binding protein
MSRVGVIWNSQNPQSLAGFKETQSAAGALGVQVESQEVRDRADFERVFQAFAKSRTRAVTVLSDSVMFSHRRPLVELAAKHKLPTMHTRADGYRPEVLCPMARISQIRGGAPPSLWTRF